MEPYPHWFVEEHALEAIVIVPGVMGSVLNDEHDTTWGFNGLGTRPAM